MSQLFYANLPNIGNPEIMQYKTVSNLLEFTKYLQTALYSLRNQTYSANWEIVSIENVVDEFFEEMAGRNHFPKDRFKCLYVNHSIQFIPKTSLNAASNPQDEESQGDKEIQENEEKLPENEGLENLSKRNMNFLKKVKKNIEKKILPTNKEKIKIWVRLIPPDKENQKQILDTFFDSDTVYQNYSENHYEKRQHLEPTPKVIRKMEVLPTQNLICLNEKPQKNKLLFVRPMTYPIEKQIDALQELQSRPKTHHRPLLRLIESSERVRWGSIKPIQDLNWFKLTDLNYPDTINQREFVKIALGTPDFAFLEGPPGSGKTYTICELIYQLIVVRHQKVLLVASTHVAVDNVLKSLFKKNPELAQLIVPVRIGDEHNIDDKIKQFRLEDRIQSIKESLISNLEELPNLSKSQQYFLNALKTDSQTVIERIILESANLICGTTIGIIKHPIFRQRRRSTQAIFDYMIIDEASKTPFTEFLVPALYTKRWIIVGDIKQLSPYVDEDQVKSNIDGELNDEEKCICADIFHLKHNLENWLKIPLKKRGKLHKLLVISEDPFILNQYAIQARTFQIPFVIITESNKTNAEDDASDSESKTTSIKPETNDSNYFSLNSVSEVDVQIALKLESSILILLTPKNYSIIEPYLPRDIDCIRSESLSDSFNRRRFARYCNEIEENWDNEINGSYNNAIFNCDPFEFLPNYCKEDDSIENEFANEWGYEIAWRLIRSFEVKADETKYTLYWDQILQLFAQFRTDRKKDLRDYLNLIVSVAFPSFLELLQKGFKRMSYKNSHCTLSDGLPEAVFNARHIILHFQNRMHPDIAEYPRQFFYLNDDALKPAPSLQNRIFLYDKYSQHAIWIDYPEQVTTTKNVNHREVAIINKELRAFCKWAKTNPNPEDEEGVWEIAVLSFYTGQEGALRVMLQKLFNSTAFYNFYGFNDLIHVALCTVDRFQGHEADVVFLSYVKTRTIGFLDNPNRLNVAITRAKHLMIHVGFKQNFLRQDKDPNLKELASMEGLRDLQPLKKNEKSRKERVRK